MSAMNYVLNQSFSAGLNNSVTPNVGAIVTAYSAARYSNPATYAIHEVYVNKSEYGREYPKKWLQYPPQPYYMHNIFTLVIFIIGAIGIPENLFSLYIFATEKSLQSPSNFIIMNLALADLLILSSNCPLNFVSGLYGRWVFGPLGCDIYGFSGCVFGLTSICTIALIAYDRLYNVMTSLSMKKISYTTIGLYVAGVWIYCTIWSAVPFFNISSYGLEGFLTTCTIDYTDQTEMARLYNLLLFIFCFMIPLLIIAGTYFKIFRILAEHQKEMEKQCKTMKQAESRVLTKKFNKSVKMAKIALYLFCGYIVAWGPYSFVWFLCAVGYCDYVTPFMSMLPAIFAKTAGLYNPLIYMASHDKFKDVLKKKYRIFRVIMERVKEEEKAQKEAQKSEVSMATTEVSSAEFGGTTSVGPSTAQPLGPGDGKKLNEATNATTDKKNGNENIEMK